MTPKLHSLACWCLVVCLGRISSTKWWRRWSAGRSCYQTYRKQYKVSYFLLFIIVEMAVNFVCRTHSLDQNFNNFRHHNQSNLSKHTYPILLKLIIMFSPHPATKYWKYSKDNTGLYFQYFIIIVVFCQFVNVIDHGRDKNYKE